MTALFGLIGKTLSHSFSANYFNKKFGALGLDARYDLFELATIEELPELLEIPALVGLNVTVPYKKAIIPYLNGLSESARKVGAVNTIVRTPEGWIGHNTDMPAFKASLQHFLRKESRLYVRLALILGTGGAAKAVATALDQLGIHYRYVSRTGEAGHTFFYHNLTQRLIPEIDLVINSTPLGMHPDIESKPDLPYHFFTPQTLAFDLVYNPADTAFMQAMRAQGCSVRNGLEMLHLQAEGAWTIWQQSIF